MYEVKQVELAVRALMDEVLRPAGVTTLQYTALTVLAGRDGLTSAELARNSFVTAQTMTDMVAALERRELITREQDPAHGRRLLISLTDKGKAFLVSRLNSDERSALHDLLNRCRAALS
jgi:DNA-binding MarR family transcriptional regulator